MKKYKVIDKESDHYKQEGNLSTNGYCKSLLPNYIVLEFKDGKLIKFKPEQLEEITNEDK